VAFTFAAGDIFDAEVDAIVSSEQTDFVLSGNSESISGQIRERYGVAIQHELDADTKGQVLRAGTVLGTSGGQYRSPPTSLPEGPMSRRSLDDGLWPRLPQVSQQFRVTR
jgi:hypothetical protein